MTSRLFNHRNEYRANFIFFIPFGILSYLYLILRKKAEHTTQYILEMVAPLFNTNGYAATSLSDITKVTGLTKGAIYGNFENKEVLAVEAFNYNIRKVIGHIAQKINAEERPTDKLQAITDFYRRYYDYTVAFGGCPILNVGVDANNQHSALTKRVKSVILKLQTQIAEIITAGVESREFREGIDPIRLASRIFALIEGAIFVAVMMRDRTHMMDMMDHLDAMIVAEIRK